MNLDLDKLEQVARAATPGEVTFGALNLCIKTGDHYHVLARCDEGKYDSKEWLTNAKFWQAACPAVVLELVRRLRAAEQDTKRLDHMAEMECYVDRARKTKGDPRCWLVFPNTGDVQVGAYESPREAIDANMPAQGASHD